MLAKPKWQKFAEQCLFFYSAIMGGWLFQLKCQSELDSVAFYDSLSCFSTRKDQVIPKPKIFTY